MIKKDVQEKIKVFQKTLETNKGDLSILESLNPIESTADIKNFSQERIKKNVNLYTSEKAFNLFLNDGPYFSSYTQNGSNMTVYNKKGYLSSFNTQNLNLNFEVDLNDTINDVKFLHNELYVAVAQKDALFIYNNCGAELHCVRDIKSPKMIEFLPYHFLLGCATSYSKLQYLDTSIGQIVANLSINDEYCTKIKHNPSNGVIHLGSKNGNVTLWAPSQDSFLMKINCHSTSVTNIEIDRSGNKMITSGLDNCIKIFDIRQTFRPVKTIETLEPICATALSQKDVLAVSHGNKVITLKNFENTPYLEHNTGHYISSLNFCNFEDILTVGHQKGISNLVIPGCGDPIYDSLECSPFITKKQRREMEVKKLLDKIPYDLIAQESIIGGLHKTSKRTIPQIKERYFEKNIERNALSRFKKE